MILHIYVTHNNERNSLKICVLDLLKRGANTLLGGGCVPRDSLPGHSQETWKIHPKLTSMLTDFPVSPSPSC
jgi:hypothetical protein